MKYSFGAPKKRRGHPDLNRGPIDLQSIALPLSYTPDLDNRAIEVRQIIKSFSQLGRLAEPNERISHLTK